jgi:ubiquitin-like modifier-activating enzyme 5
MEGPTDHLRSNVSKLHNQVRDMQEQLRVQASGASRPQRARQDQWSSEPSEGNPYARIMALQDVGTVRQYQRVQGLSVMVIGCGGIGAAVADCLCRSGVGRLLLVDGQRVTLGNMCSLFYRPDQAGWTRVQACRYTLATINPGTCLRRVVDTLALPIHVSFII